MDGGTDKNTTAKARECQFFQWNEGSPSSEPKSNSAGQIAYKREKEEGRERGNGRKKQGGETKEK